MPPSVRPSIHPSDFLINVQVQWQHLHQWAPFQVCSWLAARMADLTPDLQICLSWGSIAKSFHSLQTLSVNCFHVVLGLTGPCFPSTCMSKAVLSAPLKHSTCPYQQSLLSFRMRSRSSMPSLTSSSLDLVVTMSCGLTLQICLIIALSFCCRLWRFASLGGSVGCPIWLETRRSQVQPPPRSATFFCGDWSWNIFYGHSLPSADSRGAVVSFWRKNVHNTG